METNELNNFLVMMIRAVSVVSIVVAIIRDRTTVRTQGYFIKRIVFLVLLILIADDIATAISKIGTLMLGE